MDSDPWPSTYDRDLDAPIAAPVGRREPFHPYRRLFVNPFLAVGVCVAALLFVRAALGWRDLPAFLTGLAILGGSPLFTRFHCLDCGRSSGIFSWKHHACEPALARWREGRTGRWPFPSPKTQAVLWVYVLTSVSLLMLVLFASRR